MIFYQINTQKDIINIPENTSIISYNIKKKITFEIPKTNVVFLISSNYKYDLSFLENTNVVTLGIWDNHVSRNGQKLLNNIPYQINNLIMIEIFQPLDNLPITIQKIIIEKHKCAGPGFGEKIEKILNKSKIPFGCEIIVNSNVVKEINKIHNFPEIIFIN